MTETAVNSVSNTGILLSGMEKKLMEYLTLNRSDRFLTTNRLALAVGSNETLVLNALKLLAKSGLIRERVDSQMGTSTYHVIEQSDDLMTDLISKVVTLTPTVTEKDALPLHPIGRPEGQSEESAEIDEKIKKMYPKKGVDEIATELKITYGAVQGRIQRLREIGEITERVRRKSSGSAEPVCDVCKKTFANKQKLSAHKRVVHRIKVDIDVVYAEADKKIKTLYPAKGPTEIAKELGLSSPIVSSRLTKMHKSGEITEYWTPTSFKSDRPKIAEPTVQDVVHVTPQEPPPILQHSSFNIGQLLKVSSENQVAVVNATLEVVDERGAEYEVSINRNSKGLILSKEMLDDLIYLIEWALDMVKELLPDAEYDHDVEYHKQLLRQRESGEFILAKIRKDARIPEQKEEKGEVK